MPTQRISASSYSNTAPLIWSFLYGSRRGVYEMILDTAPARSAELLARDRVEAALVPVIAYQQIADARLVPDVCVGAREKVRSVCLLTRGMDLADVGSVALDISSKTSVALTKIIFREFLGREPDWTDARPDPETMLAAADCALLIGDPALSIPGTEDQTADEAGRGYRKFDLVELWRGFTGCGFVFAMWMTRREDCRIDFAAARDEGLAHIGEIIANYAPEMDLPRAEFERYLAGHISYSTDESMRRGLELYFELAERHGLIERNRPLVFVR